MGNFQRPRNLWLCLLSLIWIVGGFGFAAHFGLAGNFFGVVVMALMGSAAVGLWFQSRIAAWTLLGFAIVGIIYALLSIGKLPPLRIASRLCFAIASVTLLIEYLKGETAD